MSININLANLLLETLNLLLLIDETFLIIIAFYVTFKEL